MSRPGCPCFLAASMIVFACLAACDSRSNSLLPSKDRDAPIAAAAAEIATSVALAGEVFEASGTLQGKRMQTQPDATLPSQPLDGDDVKPFRVRIEC